MRSTATVLLALMVFSTSVACGDDEPAAEPTPGETSPQATAPAEGEQVASCVTGQWRSTAVSGHAGGDTVGAGLRGGSGVRVSIGEQGQTTVDFGGMQPVVFTAQVAAADIQGQFSYSGQVSATIRTGEAATPEPTGGTAPATPTGDATGTAGVQATGAWEPVGQIDWNGLRVTLVLTDPTQARLLDNAPIGDYAGEVAERTGGVVDLDPMLGPGRYRCEGERLILAPDDDRGTTWTLERA